MNLYAQKLGLHQT